ncbi:hypothetical protein OG241_39280 [Streptomyces sp. NBC_01390]|uniref:hypothetical protein n=1 Tax=Streptomyces sp. NBC_01390 TaxID=2903850 RepID=UPI00324B6E95
MTTGAQLASTRSRINACTPLASCALTAVPNVEQLPGLDSCVPSTDVRWLSATPVTHTLAPGRSLTVTVRLDAGVMAVDVAGTYTAALAAGTDTPYTYPSVPVRMTVR